MTPCMIEGCPAAATYAPKLCIPAMGHKIGSHQPIELMLGFKTCHAHFDSDAKKMLAENPNFEKMIRLMARDRATPDFDRAWIVAMPLDGDEFQEYQAMVDRSKQ